MSVEAGRSELPGRCEGLEVPPGTAVASVVAPDTLLLPPAAPARTTFLPL